MTNKKMELMEGVKNPLARRPGLVISTFGLAEIISCMTDGLVKKKYWILTNLSEIFGKPSFVEAVL
jgi:hypothetical protein